MMKKLKLIFALAMPIIFVACGGGNSDSAKPADGSSEAPKSMVKTDEYDPNRGEGKWSADNLGIGAKVDPAAAAEGDKVQGVKCSSCHKLTDEKLVGPGWKGVTTRHKPEWIMNFITNPDPMITKDPKLQAQLELCLVRMPNQSLTDQDAKNILEFMRKNDGVQ